MHGESCSQTLEDQAPCGWRVKRIQALSSLSHCLKVQRGRIPDACAEDCAGWTCELVHNLGSSAQARGLGLGEEKVSHLRPTSDKTSLPPTKLLCRIPAPLVGLLLSGIRSDNSVPW